MEKFHGEDRKKSHTLITVVRDYTILTGGVPVEKETCIKRNFALFKRVFLLVDYNVKRFHIQKVHVRNNVVHFKKKP